MVKPTENPGTQGARQIWTSTGFVLSDPDDADINVKLQKGSDQVIRLAISLPPNIIRELKGLGDRLDRIEFLLEGLAS